eukprot:4893816-Prymnesium_polylepis.1
MRVAGCRRRRDFHTIAVARTSIHSERAPPLASSCRQRRRCLGSRTRSVRHVRAPAARCVCARTGGRHRARVGA